jgi:hypothetical protein
MVVAACRRKSRLVTMHERDREAPLDGRGNGRLAADRCLTDHPRMSGFAEDSPGAGLNIAAIPWPIELEPDAVRERFRAARRSGRPRYLWPEVEPAAWREGLREIERVTHDIVAGRSAALRDGDARALGIAAFTSGTGPLLGFWVERGDLDAPEPARTLLLLHLHHGHARSRTQRAILDRALIALRDHDIDPAVLKSTATGALYFPEPGVRTGVDIDLIVSPAEFTRAEHALRHSGHERVGGQISPRKSDWRVPGMEPLPRSLELLHSGAHYGIDLHESLTRNFFGVRRLTIEGDTEQVDVRGTTFRVLSQPARLAFHALHASEGLDNLTLIRLVEIVLMIRHDTGRSLDWNDLIECLRHAGALRFAWPAFALADRLAPGTVDPAALRTLHDAATPAMRHVVAGLSPSGAQRLDTLALRERFMWCSGPADHARRLAHMLLPTPAGRSPTRLATLYADRLWRIVRGNVGIARPEPDEPND